MACKKGETYLPKPVMSSSGTILVNVMKLRQFVRNILGILDTRNEYEY
jgi:hypothetical protein